MKKRLFFILACMALLTVGCGETDKPDENTGGGSGTGGGTADRLITRLDITYTSTDGIDATERCTFTYDELKRLTVLLLILSVRFRDKIEFQVFIRPFPVQVDVEV